MNKEILYEMLKSKSERLTTAQISSIMNEELDKSPEEMDTDLVDLCLDALDRADKEKLNSKRHKLRLTRVLAAAVIFVLVVGISIPACAKFFSIDVPDGIVNFYNNCFNVDISSDNRVNDILSRLEQDGVSNAVLPKIVFDYDTEISGYYLNEETDRTHIEFSFDNGLSGVVNIDIYKSNDHTIKKLNETSDMEQISRFTVNGTNIIVDSTNEISHIQYVCGKIEYNIIVYCDYETACQIAETL